MVAVISSNSSRLRRHGDKDNKDVISLLKDELFVILYEERVSGRVSQGQAVADGLVSGVFGASPLLRRARPFSALPVDRHGREPAAVMVEHAQKSV